MTFIWVAYNMLMVWRSDVYWQLTKYPLHEVDMWHMKRMTVQLYSSVVYSAQVYTVQMYSVQVYSVQVYSVQVYSLQSTSVQSLN